VRVRLLELIESKRDIALLAYVHPLLQDPDDSVRERALRCVKTLASPSSRDPLFAAAGKEEDEFLKVEIAEALLELGDPRGFGPLVDVNTGGEAAQARRDAWEHLKAHASIEVTYRPDLPPAENGAAVAELRRWWKDNAQKLVAGENGTFRPGS